MNDNRSPKLKFFSSLRQRPNDALRFHSLDSVSLESLKNFAFNAYDFRYERTNGKKGKKMKLYNK